MKEKKPSGTPEDENYNIQSEKCPDCSGVIEFKVIFVRKHVLNLPF